MSLYDRRGTIYKKLESAVEKNDVATVQHILDREKWFVNQLVEVDDAHYSLLYLAAENGFVALAKVLLGAKANVNQQCTNGITPLMIAAKQGRTEMVEVLLQRSEIVVDLVDDLRQTAWHHAVTNKHSDIVKQLVQSKASTESNSDENTSRKNVLQTLKESVASNDLETVRAILAQEKWLVNRLVCDAKTLANSARLYSFLGLAVLKDFVAMAQLLIDANANVNQQCADGYTPLLIAATNGSEDMLRLLLAHPDIVVDMVDDEDDAPLHCAAAHGHTRIVQLLLAADARVETVNDQGDNCLTAAADHNHAGLVKWLLQHKANVNHQNRFNCTALYNAARCRDGAATVAVLLEANAAVDLPNHTGLSPLMVAADVGNCAAIRLLLAAGADVHFASKHRDTALHLAALRGRRAALAELLSAGADPAAVGDDGGTPLLYAAIGGHRDCVSALLRANADINWTDGHGDTALIHALRGAKVEMASFLMRAGADWLKKGERSARQWSRLAKIPLLFECHLCGWDGMCCLACRKKYCQYECDKFSYVPLAHETQSVAPAIDCKLHEQVAHQAVVEWALAMSSLDLPPYVLEHIFNSLQRKSQLDDYQQRNGMDFLWIPPTDHQHLNANFIHLIVEERSHAANIRLFISVQRAFQRRK